MIDSSSNVGIAQHQQLENFLKNFLIRLPVGKDKVQVGLIQYSSYPSAGFPLSMYTDRNDLLKAVDSLRYMGGGTNTADALKYMREQAFSQTSGARTDVPRIGIVITNGHSSNPTATTTEADKARSSNIGLIGVGVGSGLDLNELNNIADNPHTSNTFTISDYDQLQNSIPQILNAACNSKHESLSCDNSACTHYSLYGKTYSLGHSTSPRRSDNNLVYICSKRSFVTPTWRRRTNTRFVPYCNTLASHGSI